MRVGILSDTHDRVARAAAAVEVLSAQGAEALVHCGDLTGPEVVAVCGGLPSYFVFGNNDDDLPALRQAIAATNGVCLEWGGEITLAGKRLAVAHGHRGREVRALLARKPDYLLFGHSHVPTDLRDGPTRHINPGALHRADDYTVAVLDLAKDELQFFSLPR
jgi:putative phosphoesterase